MKRIIFLSVAVLSTAFFTFSFASDNSSATPDPVPVTTLVINADVTVVLVNNGEMNTQASGEKLFIDQLLITQKGDTLVIGSTKQRDYKEKGVVYVAAGQIKSIRINSAAHVKSLYPLNTPKIDVVVNGPCLVRVVTTGVLNLIETEKYTYEETTQVQKWPASLMRAKE
jgi:hypothetical protein